MRRIAACLLPALFVLVLSVATAQACPMCNQSIANEDHVPRAYMYSIIFMLAMPASLFSGFGLTMYWKFRKHHAARAAILAEHGLLPARENADTPS